MQNTFKDLAIIKSIKVMCDSYTISGSLNCIRCEVLINKEYQSEIHEMIAEVVGVNRVKFELWLSEDRCDDVFEGAVFSVSNDIIELIA